MLVIHFASREDVMILAKLFGKLQYVRGEQRLIVPAWIEAMWKAAKRDNREET